MSAEFDVVVIGAGPGATFVPSAARNLVLKPQSSKKEKPSEALV